MLVKQLPLRFPPQQSTETFSSSWKDTELFRIILTVIMSFKMENMEE